MGKRRGATGQYPTSGHSPNSTTKLAAGHYLSCHSHRHWSIQEGGRGHFKSVIRSTPAAKYFLRPVFACSQVLEVSLHYISRSKHQNVRRNISSLSFGYSTGHRANAYTKGFHFIFIIPFDSAYAYVFADMPYSFSPRQTYWRFVNAFYHAGYTPWAYPKTADLIIVLYLLPFALIFINSLIRIIGMGFIRRKCPECVRKTVFETRF